MKKPLLELKNCNSFYGPVQVHFDVSLTVPEQSIVCLLGGNASGKSTTMKTILGLQIPKTGSVTMEGKDITGAPTPEIVKAGISTVPEARRLFGDMTVRENLLMGAYVRDDQTEIMRDYDRVLELFPRLKERIRQKAGTMSGGEQQMVAMARALMGKPKLIIMDEPTMGLSPKYVDRVLELIATVNKTGVSVFMVEQNASMALRIADYGYVLQTGRIVLEGPANELLANPKIRSAYLGEDVA
ncbi:ABC transporter ATP-binding protein [Psychromarinibacter sp. S121]|uniref:ABC transporter ATP-binding protein n=1 Tax=Psychromarinibacter sp. S121 TaxID=3415127 RepID=UPI003C7D44F7